MNAQKLVWWVASQKLKYTLRQRGIVTVGLSIEMDQTGLCLYSQCRLTVLTAAKQLHKIGYRVTYTIRATQGDYAGNTVIGMTSETKGIKAIAV